MFGLLRLLLALDVMACHLGAPTIAIYDVRAFFVLSGYLMTKLVAERYAGRPGAFLLNRALRIYPAYWAALGLAAAALAAGHWSAGARPPSGPLEVASLLALVWPGVHHPTMLLAPAWSLAVEVAFYVAIGLGATATRARACAFFGLACGLLALVYPSGDYYVRANSLSACAFPFAAGAVAYHCRALVQSWRAWGAGAGLVGMHLLAWRLGPGHAGGLGLVLVVYPVAVLVAALDKLPPRRWDTRLGDLSYPVYLVHCQAAALPWVTGWPGAVAATLAISVGIDFVTRRTVDVLRDRVRSAGQDPLVPLAPLVVHRPGRPSLFNAR